jgi:hypothetical protein
LARAVADAWGVPHADSDDYFWLPTDPPYTRKRPVDERLTLMEQVFLPREAWVLSGWMLGWGEPVIARCEAVVFLTLDPAERLRRLDARERVRHSGVQVDEEAFERFLTWARGYEDPEFHSLNRRRHEEWLATLSCPVLRLDSARPPRALRDSVLEWEPTRA